MRLKSIQSCGIGALQSSWLRAVIIAVKFWILCLISAVAAGLLIIQSDFAWFICGVPQLTDFSTRDVSCLPLSPSRGALLIKDCWREHFLCVSGSPMRPQTALQISEGEFSVWFQRILLDSLTESMPCRLAVHDRHFVCDDVSLSASVTGHICGWRERLFI